MRPGLHGYCERLVVAIFLQHVRLRLIKQGRGFFRMQSRERAVAQLVVGIVLERDVRPRRVGAGWDLRIGVYSGRASRGAEGQVAGGTASPRTYSNRRKTSASSTCWSVTSS